MLHQRNGVRDRTKRSIHGVDGKNFCRQYHNARGCPHRAFGRAQRLQLVAPRASRRGRAQHPTISKEKETHARELGRSFHFTRDPATPNFSTAEFKHASKYSMSNFNLKVLKPSNFPIPQPSSKSRTASIVQLIQFPFPPAILKKQNRERVKVVKKVYGEETCKVDEQQAIDEDKAEDYICKICYIHIICAVPKLTSCGHMFW
jgi:hypothetical protein